MKENLQEVINNNSGLIYKVINKYHGYFDIDDLYQVGCIGLINAYNNYKNDHNTKFSSYAYLYILGEISKFVKENRTIKISKEYYKLYKNIVLAKEALTQKLMYEPSTYELSLFLEIDENIINDCISTVGYVDSLDRIISEDGKALSMYDMISFSKKDEFVDNLSLMEEISKLNNEEYNILNNRYFLNRTQSETAAIMGISQVQVSRNEQKILKKLRQNIA